MNLKKKFSLNFLEEFQYDGEFHSLLMAMERNVMTPYEAIEHLCKSKKELQNALLKALGNAPIKMMVTSERFEEIKKEMDKETF